MPAGECLGTEVGSGQAGGPGDCKPFAGSVLAREPALCGTKAGSPLPTLPTDRRESRAGRSLWCFSTSLPVRKPSPKQPRKPPSRQRKKKNALRFQGVDSPLAATSAVPFQWHFVRKQTLRPSSTSLVIFFFAGFEFLHESRPVRGASGLVPSA